MDDIKDLDDYAIIIIYPDGQEEKIHKDDRVFHMQYMVSLIKKSSRLQEIIKNNDFYIPTDEMEIKLTMTYPLDELLAKEGIITLHNLDFENDEDIEDWERVFHITLPSDLSMEQIEIFKYILSNYDFSMNWFGKIIDGKLVDIDYCDVENMINKNTK